MEDASGQCVQVGDESWAVVSSFQTELKMLRKELQDTHLRFLLDSEEAVMLDAACRLLPSTADSTTDFKVPGTGNRRWRGGYTVVSGGVTLSYVLHWMRYSLLP